MMSKSKISKIGHFGFIHFYIWSEALTGHLSVEQLLNKHTVQNKVQHVLYFSEFVNSPLSLESSCCASNWGHTFITKGRLL